MPEGSTKGSQKMEAVRRQQQELEAIRWREGEGAKASTGTGHWIARERWSRGGTRTEEEVAAAAITPIL